MDTSTRLDELKRWPNWIVRRADKIPLNPHTGQKASVIDPQTWSTFEVAAACCANDTALGLGFVLTEADPFCFIDLDYSDDPAIVANQKEISNGFNTYSERSPSTKGLHIIGKGSVPSGKKQNKVEVYSSKRYMTVTFDVVNDAPVGECQQQLNELLVAMNKGQTNNVPTDSFSQPQTQSDEQILNTAAHAANGDLFKQLWAGNWQDKYKSQSEADFAFIDIVAFYTDSMEQVKRIFLASALGERIRTGAKRKHANYIKDMIKKSQDGKVAPVVDPNNFTISNPFQSATVPQPLNKWPAPLGDAAQYGLTGEFLKLVAPESEADPAALCVVFLTAMGSVIGDNLYRAVGGTKHHSNLFATIVGKSAKARKGQTTADAMQVIELVDPIWFNTRTITGLTSGEGVIDYVRDGLGDDPGEFDKRLFVNEGEFAQVLTMTQRDGNNLSIVLRLAWDSVTLQVASRSNKNKCRHPHISIVANITLEELLRLLSSTNKANGFANRFLWVLAQRSKQLPFGGNPLNPTRLDALVKQLQAVCAWAKDAQCNHIHFDRDVEEWWKDAYEHLTNYEPTGSYGQVIARSETQVLRLAMLYAILDRSLYITKNHLCAAMEVWRYCEESARYIFGDATGDATVDTIYKAIMAASAIGLTRTEISKLFNNNQSKQELDRALTLLEGNKKLQLTIEPTLGASIKRWCRI